MGIGPFEMLLLLAIFGLPAAGGVVIVAVLVWWTRRDKARAAAVPPPLPDLKLRPDDDAAGNPGP